MALPGQVSQLSLLKALPGQVSHFMWQRPEPYRSVVKREVHLGGGGGAASRLRRQPVSRWREKRQYLGIPVGQGWTAWNRVPVQECHSAGAVALQALKAFWANH